MEIAASDRIIGVETEFGCLVDPIVDGGYEIVVDAVKDHIFHNQRLGAIDRHPRDEAFEPAYSGGFLINGGRLYVDAVGSHEEYATAECRNFWDLIANDRAGQRIIVRALKELELDGVASFYNNSVDHFGGHTFGCHENYLVFHDDHFLNESVHFLYPFLVTRQIFSGVGRVGGHILDFSGHRPNYREITRNPVDYIWVSNIYGVRPDPTVRYQLSQRADHIIKAIASRVRFNRALINPKWETFHTHGSTRLHLLFGESNQMEYAYALKIGTTCLMLSLIECGLIPDHLRLADPLTSLRHVSRDETFKWHVVLENGSTIGSIDLQREYLRLAQKFSGHDAMTDWTLQHWEATLDGLEKDPMQLGDRLDWVAKYQIIEEYIANNPGVTWEDESLHSIDLEYHNIDPDQSLYGALLQMGSAKRIVDDIQIIDSMTEPPPNTRAFGRSQLVRWLLKKKATSYWIDWDTVYLDRQNVVSLKDPFDTYANIVSQISK